MLVKTAFIDFVSDKISTPKIILEIGSRDALQSVEFSRLFPEAKIYAFECNPPSIKTCIENAKNYKNIEIVPYAVFNKNEKGINFYPVLTNIGASSLFRFIDVYPSIPNRIQKEITVDAIRIDTWAKEKGIEKIDLIWIDLQGAGYEAFEGMGKLLSDVQAIYTEVEYQRVYKNQKLLKDVLKLLNEKGFSMIRNQPSKINWWGNAIFINNKF